ncbi:MAG TPA: hypothetical protein VJA21_26145 [Verrucomicrobiae bacterium]
MLPDKTLALIQNATEGRVRFFTNDPPFAPEEYRLRLLCPADLDHFFKRLEEPRELIETFVKREFPVVGTTYLAPEFALGSVNRGDLWNQRRSLVAYWGTAQRPAYLHLRFLHDGYDFADAQFFSVQRQGTVLAGVVLGTDGGDTHVSLDRITNGMLRARDLRLRFEFGGSASSRSITVPDRIEAPVALKFGEVRLDLQVLFACFGREDGRWEAGADPAKKTAWLDMVFYSGERREFKIRELEQAAAGFCLSISAGQQGQPVVSGERHDGRFELKSKSPELHLSLPVKPAKVGELQRQPH